MSKIERAKSIVAANPSASRSDIIALFMSELAMSKAGATTYYYNATSSADRPAKTEKVKAAKVSKLKSTKAERQVETQKVASAAQIMKAAEKAAALKRKEIDSAKIRAELDEFVNNIEGYDFPNGTLGKLHPNRYPDSATEVDQDKVDEIKEKNLRVMKKVQKTFIQDVA